MLYGMAGIAGRITDALDRSRFFIVTLSPGAAASYWVDQEVGYWLARRGREQLMLVQAAGTLQWDKANLEYLVQGRHEVERKVDQFWNGVSLTMNRPRPPKPVATTVTQT